MSIDFGLDKEIKVILIGDSGVGKTNLINIALGLGFNAKQEATSAASFSRLNIKTETNNISIDLWDTIGQEKYKQLTKLFYNNSRIVIFVYDIASRITFEGLTFWINDIKEQIGNDYVAGVIGNKSDLYLEEEVKREEGDVLAKSINAEFLLISAKNNERIKFIDFLKVLVEKGVSNGIIDLGENNNIVLKKDKEIKKKKCCN
jgi:small GTP-binding protein